jgi:hypothetical protein
MGVDERTGFALPHTTPTPYTGVQMPETRVENETTRGTPPDRAAAISRNPAAQPPHPPFGHLLPREEKVILGASLYLGERVGVSGFARWCSPRSLGTSLGGRRLSTFPMLACPESRGAVRRPRTLVCGCSNFTRKVSFSPTVWAAGRGLHAGHCGPHVVSSSGDRM